MAVIYDEHMTLIRRMDQSFEQTAHDELVKACKFAHEKVPDRRVKVHSELKTSVYDYATAELHIRIWTPVPWGRIIAGCAGFAIFFWFFYYH